MATPGPASRGRRAPYDVSNMANMSNMSNMATMARVEATMATIQSELRGKEAKEEHGAKKLRKKIKDKEEEIEELEKKLSTKENTKDKSRGRRGGKHEKKEGTKKVAVVAFETLEKQLEGRRNELEEKKREVSRSRKNGYLVS